MGLLKAVCLDSMLARLASARLPVRRCDLVLCVLGERSDALVAPDAAALGQRAPFGHCLLRVRVSLLVLCQTLRCGERDTGHRSRGGWAEEVGAQSPSHSSING